MKRVLGLIMAAVSLISVPSDVVAQKAPTAQGDAAAKAAEAHAIIEIMYPPATRGQMIDQMLAGVTAPLHQNMAFLNDMNDPGLKALFKDFFDQILDRQRPLMARHLPALMDAMAAAYSHMFSLAELKDIRSFAESPAGHTYFSHMTSILGDPAVQKVSADMIEDAQQSVVVQTQEFRDKVTAYLKEHPKAADELKAIGESKTAAK